MFRPLILPKQAPVRIKQGGSEAASLVASASDLESHQKIWNKTKTDVTLQNSYDEYPASWKEGGVVYTSTAACFDRNMWIAADIAKDYTIAISKNNLPAAKKIESIGAAVRKINFLLDRGLEQDRSLPLSEVRLVPPSLQKTKLEDMKRALVGAYHHLASKGADGEKRAYHLYMAHAASEKPNSFLSPMWSASRKTEALYEAASALKEKYEAANPPRVEDCEISHDFCRAAQESIGLGVYNYSDVTKSAGKTLVDQIESDLTNVFGADAASIKKRRTQKPELAALWARIASPLDVPAEPEWVSGILPLD